MNELPVFCFAFFNVFHVFAMVFMIQCVRDRGMQLSLGLEGILAVFRTGVLNESAETIRNQD